MAPAQHMVTTHGDNTRQQHTTWRQHNTWQQQIILELSTALIPSPEKRSELKVVQGLRIFEWESKD